MDWSNYKYFAVHHNCRFCNFCKSNLNLFIGMEAEIYINTYIVGQANFRIADESMGAIIGELKPNANYEKFKEKIQVLTEEKGLANSSELSFRIVINKTIDLKPEGGIGITHIKSFDEIFIESAGNGQEVIEMIKKEACR
jgi:hypothetical protein